MLSSNTFADAAGESIHQHSSPFASPGKLTAAQLKVVVSLAQGKTVTAAAREAGVHRTTIHHWLRTQADFAQAAQEAADEYQFQLTDELIELAAAALATLRALLEDPKTPPSVRLKAALAILERPRSPELTWTLPTTVETPDQIQAAENLALVEANYKARKMAASARNPVETPRNAPCPCGSGLKYKRCCAVRNDAKARAGASPNVDTVPKPAAN